MNTSETIEKYFQVLAEHETSRGGETNAEGRRPFITISRQTGAGGHALARALWREMSKASHIPLFQGWRIWDEEICRRILAHAHWKVSLRDLSEERYRSLTEEFFRGVAGFTPQESVAAETFKIIRAAALEGKAIIVGRAGACVARGFPWGIHIRLVAPERARIARMGQVLGVPEKEAAVVLADRDKSRADLVRSFFQKDINDPLLYDATFNTGRWALEEIASLVMRMANARLRRKANNGRLVNVR